MESYKPIQDNQLPTGDYDKNGFIQAIKNMSYEEFNRFCREIIHLDHYYFSTHGASVCEIKTIVIELS